MANPQIHRPSPNRTMIAALRRWLLLTALALYFLIPTLATAETVDPDPGPPPVITGINTAGYDLITGRFTYTATEVSIGQEGMGGLVFTRTFFGSGWRDNYAGTINSSGAVYTVSLGQSSESFTLDSGVFSSDQHNGSTLTVASGIYTYTERDGSIALFDSSLANGAIYDANVARVTGLTRPSGEQILWHYVSVTLSGETARRLQSVTNNVGYQIHFDYALNGPASPTDFDAWRTLQKATGINMAVDYCDPIAASCASFTQTWPYTTYATIGGGAYSTATDTMGHTTYYGGSSDGLSRIRQPSSATDNILIDYNDGLLANISNGAGTWTYSYTAVSAGHRTTTVTDPLGHTRVIQANVNELEVISDTDGAGQTTSYLYDADHRVTRMTLPEGNYVNYTYDARGNQTETRIHAKPGTSIADIVTTASFPNTCTNALTCNQPSATTDARGFQTDYSYSATHGNVLSVTLPAPIVGAVRPQTRYGYTPLHAYFKTSTSSGPVEASPPVYLLTSTSSCATSEWTTSCGAGVNDETLGTIEYGSTGTANNLLPTRTTTASGDGTTLSASTNYTFTPQGDLASIDGPLSGATDVFWYDNDRHRVGTVGPDPDGSGTLKNRAVRYTYDADGRVVLRERGTTAGQLSSDWSTFAPLLQQATVFNSIGQPLRQNILSSTGTILSMTQYSYDAAGRLECSAQRVNPAYFSNPNTSACNASIVGQNLGADRIQRTTYDNADRVVRVQKGYGSLDEADEWTGTYTNNGLIASIADGDTHLTTYVYDRFDRIYQIQFPNASGGGSSSSDYEQYGYDAGSNTTSDRRRDGSSIAYTFDALNRVTQATPSSNGSAVAYTYDNLGRRLTSADSNQTLTFTYDQLSRNLSQTSPLGTVNYQYDLSSRRTRVTWPDGFYVTYAYDNADDLTTLSQNGSTTLATYSYDDLARQTGMARDGGSSATQAISYDTASNVAQFTQHFTTSSNDLTLTLTHNSLGQTASRASDNAAYEWAPISPVTQTYSTNGRNQYTSVGSSSYSYDSRGNLTSDGTHAFTYDIFNRVITESHASHAAAVTYDPAGRIYETTGTGATTTHFLYDGTNIIEEFDNSGTALHRYVYGTDGPIVRYDGSTTPTHSWLVPDNNGSIIALTSSSGTTINSYDEYGQIQGPDLGRFRYAGMNWLSEVGLYHAGLRDYSPSIGRWMQADPILFDGGMNLYAYVGDDPVNRVDPMGLTDYDCSQGPGHLNCPVDPSKVPVEPGDTVTTDRGTNVYEGNGVWDQVIVVTGHHELTQEEFRQASLTYSNELATDICRQFCLDLLLAPLGIEERLGRLFARACGCFVAGTEIQTPEGPRPIETLSVGQSVISIDPETNERTVETITELIRPGPRIIWRVSGQNPDGTMASFQVTDDHPWYVEGAGWTETSSLRSGERVATADHRGLVITDVARTDRVDATYNISVTGSHTFLAGSVGVVVHNGFCSRAWSAFWGRMGSAFHRHHVFPQKFRAAFERLGINIDNVRFGSPVRGDLHLGWSAEYNREWEAFLATNPTREEVLDFGRHMGDRYGFETRF